MKDTFFCPNQTINCQGAILDLSQPKVMGILNVTTDSFYAKSRHLDIENNVFKAIDMIENGVDIIDIGGYSSRPGATDISAQEEMDRVIPVIEQIRNDFSQQIISIDTFRSDVAKEALKSGANIVNDISGGEMDKNMLAMVGAEKAPYIMMHMNKTPQTMQINPINSKVVVKEVLTFFSKQVSLARENNITDIILDPGLGFGKTIESNFKLLKSLKEIALLELPILIGVSRKSMIYKSLNGTAESSLNGTTFLHALALKNGAKILRAHDVKEAKECIKLWNDYDTSTDL